MVRAAAGVADVACSRGEVVALSRMILPQLLHRGRRGGLLSLHSFAFRLIQKSGPRRTLCGLVVPISRIQHACHVSYVVRLLFGQLTKFVFSVSRHHRHPNITVMSRIHEELRGEKRKGFLVK